MDDFDQIQTDLLPFWSLKPEELRKRVWHTTANQWNEIDVLKIRDGSIDIGPNTNPTHRWMVEGVKSLIDSFAEYLPDMDLPLNLNDESRVAVPWEDMQIAITEGSEQKSYQHYASAKWSKNRADGWHNTTEQGHYTTHFEERSWRDSFSSYAAPTCSPQSSARREPYWNTNTLCTKCIEPHSIGNFVSNWSLSADICHQPDLAKLHGFFISPSAFKVTNSLMPIFSQSKISGFNDIMYVCLRFAFVLIRS